MEVLRAAWIKIPKRDINPGSINPNNELVNSIQEQGHELKLFVAI